MNDKSKYIVEHLALLAILIFIGVVIPQMLGLSMQGFDEQKTLNQFFLYAILAAGSAVGILILVFVNVYYVKDDRFTNSILFYSPAEHPSPRFLFFKRTFMLFFICLLVFSFIFGIAPIFSEQTFFGTGVPVVRQQFSTEGKVAFSNLLVPISENLVMAFIVALYLTILKINVARQKVSFESYRFLAIGGTFALFIASGLLNHLFVYRDSEASLIGVANFWFVGAAITVLTGSFIPFWVAHFTNNLFLDLGRYFSNDVVTIAAGVAIVVSVIGLFLFQFLGKKRVT